MRQPELPGEGVASHFCLRNAPRSICGASAAGAGLRLCLPGGWHRTTLPSPRHWLCCIGSMATSHRHWAFLVPSALAWRPPHALHNSSVHDRARRDGWTRLQAQRGMWRGLLTHGGGSQVQNALAEVGFIGQLALNPLLGCSLPVLPAVLPQGRNQNTPRTGEMLCPLESGL